MYLDGRSTGGKAWIGQSERAFTASCAMRTPVLEASHQEQLELDQSPIRFLCALNALASSFLFLFCRVRAGEDLTLPWH